MHTLRSLIKQLTPASDLLFVQSGQTDNPIEGTQCFERCGHLFTSCEIGMAGLSQDFSSQRVVRVNEHDGALYEQIIADS